MDIASKLKSLRLDRKYTQQEVASKLDISTSAYGFYEQGKNVPPLDKVIQLAELYNVSLDTFSSNRLEEKVGFIKVKVYGEVPAGIPIEAIEDVRDMEELSLDRFDINKQYIGLVVKGDSMYPKYIEGDTIIVEVTPTAESGTDCVVYVNGYNATLKKLVHNSDGSITLVPLNPNYAPATYGEGDDEVKVLGIVREIRRKI